MLKGKYSISLNAAAVIAFVFAALNMPIPAVLAVGYAALAEQSEWLTRQALQAVFLLLTGSFLKTIISSVFNSLGSFVGKWTYELANFCYSAGSVLSGLISILVFILAIVGIVKVAKGKEASLPLLGGFAAKATGAVLSKPKPAAPAAPAAPVTPAAPAAPTTPAAPAAPAAPTTPAAPAAPAAPTAPAAPKMPAAPEAPAAPAAPEGMWVCSCGKENSGKFCTKCGRPRV